MEDDKKVHKPAGKIKPKFSYIVGGIGFIIFGLFISSPFSFFWGLISFLGFFTAGVFLILKGAGKL